MLITSSIISWKELVLLLIAKENTVSDVCTFIYYVLMFYKQGLSLLASPAFASALPVTFVRLFTVAFLVPADGGW